MPKRKRNDHGHQVTSSPGGMPKRKRISHALSEYRHEPLSTSSRQIRLIRLQASCVLSDVVKCEIETFNIDRVPAYEAISYAWGDASDRTYIKVGVHHRLLITKSLDTALRYMRHPHKDRLLWADAVCINQNNTAEKNEVVARMHNIYQDAQQVIVWLGQPIRPWSFRVILDMPDQVHENDPRYFRGACQIENRLNKNARTLLKFGQLPWFSRGWVLQEVCFARDIQVQYGRHLLSWEHFKKLATKLSLLLPQFLEWEVLGERAPYIAIREAISGIAEARLRLLHNEQATTLGSLLAIARTKCTSDPRDKIFAFLNLLPVLPSSLQVDYGMEIKTLFIKVAQLLLRGTVGLRLLAECELTSSSQIEGNRACFPSWVPNWAQSRVCESLPGGFSPSFRGDEFSAGTHLPASEFKILDDILLIEAQIWDDIVFLNPVAEVARVVSYVHTEISRSLTKYFGIKFPSNSAVTPAVNLSNVACRCCGDFERLCSRLEMCNRDSEGRKIVGDDIWRPRPTAEAHRKLVGRSQLLTSRRFVGWAPPAAACGDVISIIPGCHVPIVLRKIHDGGSVPGKSALSSHTRVAQKQIQEERLSSYIVIGEACKFVTTCGRSLADKVFRCAWTYGGRGQAQLGQRQQHKVAEDCGHVIDKAGVVN
jgi:Heterokaryon incompatibility protein (HET)